MEDAEQPEEHQEVEAALVIEGEGVLGEGPEEVASAVDEEEEEGVIQISRGVVAFGGGGHDQARLALRRMTPLLEKNTQNLSAEILLS